MVVNFNAPRQAKPSQCHNNPNDGCCLIYETQFEILFSNYSNISTNLNIYEHNSHLNSFYFLLLLLFYFATYCVVLGFAYSWSRIY